MNAAWGHIVGVMIVVLMLTFISIWIWAWRPYHRKNFDSLSRIPMRDDAAPAADYEDRMQ